MVGNLSSDGVTIKTLVGGNGNIHKSNVMKTRSQKTCCIGCCAAKTGPCPPVKNHSGVGKYAAGTNSSPEHPSRPQKLRKCQP